MENNLSQTPFSEILHALFDQESPSIPSLYRLSDMTHGEMAEFQQRWASVTVDTRYVIVRHLADISEESYLVDFSPVLSICLNDEDKRIRLTALEGLGESTDGSLINSILNLLQNDPEIEVKAAAARMLGKFLLLIEIGQLKSPMFDSIFEDLMGEYRDPICDISVKAAILEAISLVSLPEITRWIEETFESSSPQMQISAIYAMGNSGDSRWLPLLTDELDNPSADIRIEAAGAVGKIGNPQVVEKLAKLIDDEDEDVALMAIYSLGQIGGKKAIQFLEDILQDLAYDTLYEAAEEALDEAEWSEVDPKMPNLIEFDADLGSISDSEVNP